jgi:hypothetical protein
LAIAFIEQEAIAGILSTDIFQFVPMRYQDTHRSYCINLYRRGIRSTRLYLPLWLGMITVVLLACISLPEPEIKFTTLAYEPHPERRLAVAIRNILKGEDPGVSGFPVIRIYDCGRAESASGIAGLGFGDDTGAYHL